MPRPREHPRGGFTLIEVMMTITILVLVSVLVLPKFGNDARSRLMAATGILSSDIELAQVMTLSNPASPIVLYFNPATSMYRLAHRATPNTAILRAGTTEPYEVFFGRGRAVGAEGVTIALTDLPGSTLSFNEVGGILDPTTNPVITLNLRGQWSQLTIAPTTGLITGTSGGS